MLSLQLLYLYSVEMAGCHCGVEIPDFVMATLSNRAGHYIFILWFLLSFFPRLFSAVADWKSTILPHDVALVRI